MGLQHNNEASTGFSVIQEIRYNAEVPLRLLPKLTEEYIRRPARHSTTRATGARGGCRLLRIPQNTFDFVVPFYYPRKGEHEYEDEDEDTIQKANKANGTRQTAKAKSKWQKTKATGKYKRQAAKRQSRKTANECSNMVIVFLLWREPERNDNRDVGTGHR